MSVLTLCLDCGARRPGIGGSNCLRCGSMALQLRAAHILVPIMAPAELKLTVCSVCEAQPPSRGHAGWLCAGLGFETMPTLPDCETTAATLADEVRDAEDEQCQAAAQRERRAARGLCWWPKCNLTADHEGRHSDQKKE